MNVLVTGGAGYIGSHCAKALAIAGHYPVSYDNLSRGNAWAVRWGPLVSGDLADRELVARTLQKYRIEAVIHLAAYAYVGESMCNPEAYFQNNSLNSLHLLGAVRELGIPYFVFSSTCATYGTPQCIPIAEDHPQLPVNPYGESKLFVEKLLRWYGEIHGTKWTALRYFNAAGADQEGELGECHNPETHLVPLILESTLHPNQPIFVFGTDYPTPDGTAIRDYIHVSDLADAHVRALEYLVRGGESRPFNLGTGFGHSVHEVLQTVTMVTGKHPSTRYVERRMGDPPALVAKAQAAGELLGWFPRYSRLSEILESAWQWRLGATLQSRLTAFDYPSATSGIRAL
jgi:UDP-arabinose 4-epimerase